MPKRTPKKTSKSAKVNNPNALHEAAANPNGYKTLKALMSKAKLDLNIPHTETGLTAIEMAAQTGSVASFQLLESHGASLASRHANINGQMNPVCLLLCAERNTAILNLLTDESTGYYLRFNDGTTAAHLAAIRGDVNFFIKCIDDIDYVSDKKLSQILLVNVRDEGVLNWANYFLQYDVIAYLLSRSVFVDAVSLIDTDANHYDLARAHHLNVNAYSDASMLEEKATMFKIANDFYERIKLRDESMREMIDAFQVDYLRFFETYHLQVESQSTTPNELVNSWSDEATDSMTDDAADEATDELTDETAHEVVGEATHVIVDTMTHEMTDEAVNETVNSEPVVNAPDVVNAPEMSSRQQYVDVKHANDLGFMVKNVPGDGNCFFHAFADQLKAINLYTRITAQQLRENAIDFILQHPDGFDGFTEDNLQEYILRQSRSGEYADSALIYALAKFYNVNVYVLDADVKLPPIILRVNSDLDADFVCLSHSEKALHYQSLRFVGTEEQWLHISNSIAAVEPEAKKIASAAGEIHFPPVPLHEPMIESDAKVELAGSIDSMGLVEADNKQVELNNKIALAASAENTVVDPVVPDIVAAEVQRDLNEFVAQVSEVSYSIGSMLTTSLWFFARPFISLTTQEAMAQAKNSLLESSMLIEAEKPVCEEIRETLSLLLAISSETTIIDVCALDDNASEPYTTPAMLSSCSSVNSLLADDDLLSLNFNDGLFPMVDSNPRWPESVSMSGLFSASNRSSRSSSPAIRVESVSDQDDLTKSGSSKNGSPRRFVRQSCDASVDDVRNGLELRSSANN